MGKIPVELTVTIKGTDSTYKQKFLIYETVTMSDECPSVKECIEEVKKDYKGDVEEIKVRACFQYL